MLCRVVADPIVEWSPDARLTHDSFHLLSPLICGSLLYGSSPKSPPGKVELHPRKRASVIKPRDRFCHALALCSPSLILPYFGK